MASMRSTTSNVIAARVRHTWTNLFALDKTICCHTRHLSYQCKPDNLESSKQQLIDILAPKHLKPQNVNTSSSTTQPSITTQTVDYQSVRPVKHDKQTVAKPIPAQESGEVSSDVNSAWSSFASKKATLAETSSLTRLKYLLRSSEFSDYLSNHYPNVTRHQYRSMISAFARYVNEKLSIDSNDVRSVSILADHFVQSLYDSHHDPRLLLSFKVSKRLAHRMKAEGISLHTLDPNPPSHQPKSKSISNTTHAVPATTLENESGILSENQSDDQSVNPLVSPHEIEIDFDETENFEKDEEEEQRASQADIGSRLFRDMRNRLLEDPALSEFADLSQPHEWYPAARTLNRKIVLHVGPTNSGKTHSAMKALRAAQSGVYCGPLRLLSWECYDRLTSEGCVTNLITGQEKIEHAGATHISCTVEMVSDSQLVDVAVIDEAQLIASDDRGNHWTRAFLGIPARELHVCGDPSIVSLLTEICTITGETLEIHNYTRLTPLKLSAPLNSSFKSLRRGDAVIAFSRTSLYEIKNEIEHVTPLKCCIVYGALPPSLRRQQAALFNDPRSGYDVLVASDAVGMGLNLQIGRVVLHSLQKFDGKQRRKLTTRELLQIAGRAGRYKSEFPVGYVTVLHDQDFRTLRQIISEPVEDLERAGLSPSLSQIEQFHRIKPGESLKSLLQYFDKFAMLDDAYFMTSLQDMSDIAELLEQFPEHDLTLSQRFQLCLCPVDIGRESQHEAFVRYVTEFTKTRKMTIGSLSALRSMSAILQGGGSSGMEVAELEDLWHQLDLYSWMSRHFGIDVCVDLVTAERIRDEVSETIAAMLEESSATSRGARRIARMAKRENRVEPRLRKY